MRCEMRYAGLGQVHGACGRQAHLCRQSRPLAADRVLDHLHQHRVALVDQALDRWRLLLRELAEFPDVGDVQESGTLEVRCR